MGGYWSINLSRHGLRTARLLVGLGGRVGATSRVTPSRAAQARLA
jgi:hypothetical protein